MKDTKKEALKIMEELKKSWERTLILMEEVLLKEEKDEYILPEEIGGISGTYADEYMYEEDNYEEEE